MIKFCTIQEEQKQSFADVLQNRCFQKCCKFHKKASALESILIKVAGLKTYQKETPAGVFL